MEFWFGAGDLKSYKVDGLKKCQMQMNTGKRGGGKEGREEGNYDNRIIPYPLPSQYLKTGEFMY